MSLYRRLAAGALALAISGTAAVAADVAPLVVPPVAPVVIAPAVPSFDWSGLYVGIYGGFNRGIPPGAVGATAGFNIVNGRLLFGAEARLGGFFPGEAGFDVHLEGLGRAGLLIGDRTLAYGTAGVGTVFCCSFTYWFAGGGVELGLGERLSVFGEARVFDDVGGGFFPSLMLRTGINLHL